MGVKWSESFWAATVRLDGLLLCLAALLFDLGSCLWAHSLPQLKDDIPASLEPGGLCLEGI